MDRLTYKIVVKIIMERVYLYDLEIGGCIILKLIFGSVREYARK
jgi:hypothetical protein